jgi:hypothetical protein
MRLVLVSLFAIGGIVAGAFVWLSSAGDGGGTRARLDYSATTGAITRRSDSGSNSRRSSPTDGGAKRTIPSARQSKRSVQVVPALLEKGPHGALPKISPDGRAAWRVYGRPHNARDRRPRIAVIITGLGLKRDVTESAIDDLPGVVSLAFSVYGRNLKALAASARKAGHEVLVTLPLETAEDSGHDPGPRALAASLSTGKNRDRLHWITNQGRSIWSWAKRVNGAYLSLTDVPVRARKVPRCLARQVLSGRR